MSNPEKGLKLRYVKTFLKFLKFKKNPFGI